MVGMPEAGSRAEVIRSAYAALNARDTDALMGMLAPEAVFCFRPPGGREEILRGPEELVAFYNALYRIFDHVLLDYRELEEIGDDVHAKGVVTLRMRDTGHSTQANFRHVLTVQRGLITAAVYNDPVNPLELMRSAAELPPLD